MASKPSSHITNNLLDQLPESLQWDILDQCSQAQLACGETLYRAGDPLTHVYFPLTGFITQVADTPHHKALEVGMIGNEGMLGASLTLGVNTAPLQSVVQGSGLALRMPERRFRQHLEGSTELRTIVQRYQFFLIEQLGQLAVCNAFHEVPGRLARWLLMTHDRAHANHFHLTHAFLAEMLGVRRSAVSIAASAIQDQGLISYSRGHIRVQSRPGLEAAACRCYELGVKTYKKHFTTPAG